MLTKGLIVTKQRVSAIAPLIHHNKRARSVGPCVARRGCQIDEQQQGCRLSTLVNLDKVFYRHPAAPCQPYSLLSLSPHSRHFMKSLHRMNSLFNYPLSPYYNTHLSRLLSAVTILKDLRHRRILSKRTVVIIGSVKVSSGVNNSSKHRTISLRVDTATQRRNNQFTA